MDNANERVSLQFQNSVTGQGKLDKYEQRLLSLKKIIETFPKSLNWDLGGNDYTKTLQKTNDLLINLNKNMSGFKKSTTSSLGEIKKPITETNKEIQNISSNLKPVNKDLEQKILTYIGNQYCYSICFLLSTFFFYFLHLTFFLFCHSFCHLFRLLFSCHSEPSEESLQRSCNSVWHFFIIFLKFLHKSVDKL